MARMLVFTLLASVLLLSDSDNIQTRLGTAGDESQTEIGVRPLNVLLDASSLDGAWRIQSAAQHPPPGVQRAPRLRHLEPRA